MTYNCDFCNFHTIRRDNYKRHLETMKHIELMKSKPKVSPNTSKSKPKVSPPPPYDPDENRTDYVCKYCDKLFKHKQSMSKHIKYSCKQNKDEDLKELVRLMNLQLQQKDEELEYQKKQNEKQQKQIDKLMDKLQVNHITNNTFVQNNILSYRDTDVSHLTNKDYEKAIQKVNSCVKDMIEKIHFNPLKPENMNIYISNMKDKYIMIYEDGIWNIKNKTPELNELYDEKEMLLEDWLDTYGNEKLRQKFDKYLNNKSQEETLLMIKENIKMMLYNKKKLIHV